MNESRRHRIAWITRTCAGAAALLVAILIYAVLYHTKPQVQPSDAARLRPRVSVFTAQRVPVRRQWNGFGTVDAMDTADIPARVTATVEHIPADTLAGNPVSKGQLLVRIDESDFRRQLEISQEAVRELEAALELIEVERQRLTAQLKLEEENFRIAEEERDRVEELYSQGAANTQGRDRARREALLSELRVIEVNEALDGLGPRKAQLAAQQAGQEASRRLAQLNVERCRIVSPIDGILQYVDVEIGEELRPGMRVGRVVNLDKVEVPLRLPAASRRDLAVGDEALLTAANDADRCWTARVARIAPEDDPATRTVTVYVAVDQAEEAADFGSGDGSGLLIPGAFVSGVVTSERSAPRWLTPRRAVRNRRVLLVEDGVIVSRPVEVDFVIEGRFPEFGLLDDQWAVLGDETAGLSDGELVLANGAAAVLDGDHVEPVLPKTRDVVERGDNTAPVDAVGASTDGSGADNRSAVP